MDCGGMMCEERRQVRKAAGKSQRRKDIWSNLPVFILTSPFSSTEQLVFPIMKEKSYSGLHILCACRPEAFHSTKEMVWCKTQLWQASTRGALRITPDFI